MDGPPGEELVALLAPRTEERAAGPELSGDSLFSVLLWLDLDELMCARRGD